jgi:hypothetical protein
MEAVMDGRRRLTIEEKLEIHKREQSAQPNAMIVVKDVTDVNGIPIVTRRVPRES